jgi:hypothetical protein
MSGGSAVSTILPYTKMQRETNLPSEYTTIDGQSYRIVDRQLVSYEKEFEVTRNGKTVREWRTISFTVGTVRPA